MGLDQPPANAPLAPAVPNLVSDQNTSSTAFDLTTRDGLASYLALTEFAAADIKTIGSGEIGFTYRVFLKNPSARKSVVVKHGLEYARSDKSQLCSPERMAFEYEALTAVDRSGLVTPESVVQVPRVLLFDAQTHTLIMEDLAPVRSLSHVLMEAFKNRTIESVSSQIGAALGDFMGKFHKWSAQPEQAKLRKRFLENVTSIESVPRVWYRRMMSTADMYEMRRPWMEEFVQQRMKDAQDGGDVVIMGDFWVENILVSTEPDLRLYVIDWEMARCARSEVDLGYFAAALSSIAYIHRPSSSNFPFMNSFMKNYSKSYSVDEMQLAFAAGLYVMSFGPEMSWGTPWGEHNRKEVAEYGLGLLEAGVKGDVEEIKKNVILRGMYEVDPSRRS